MKFNGGRGGARGGRGGGGRGGRGGGGRGNSSSRGRIADGRIDKNSSKSNFHGGYNRQASTGSKPGFRGRGRGGFSSNEGRFQQRHNNVSGRGGGRSFDNGPNRGKQSFMKHGKFNYNSANPKSEIKVKEEEDSGDENDTSKHQGFFLSNAAMKKEESTGPEDAYSFGDSGKKSKNKKKSGGFQGMGLSPLVLKGILRRGYNIPTPIQRKAIPPMIEGRDVVAMARTGSGKTAAFLIPLFEKLQVKKAEIGTSAKFPRALILSPTRELAQQTVKFIREIGRFMQFNVATILGGESMESQFQTMHDKPDVVVATPGRFMHLCVEMELNLNGVEYVVFDEADRLFEMGFGEQLMEIIKRLPDHRQTALFSATLPKQIVEFSKAGLNDPTLIRLDVETKLPDQLALTYLACRSEDKLGALLYLLKNVIDERQQTIVFTSTKHHVEFIHQLLDEANVSNCYIYSSLDPAARKISLGKFRNGKCNVMVVTDIAARGIDIPILDNVINFHFPSKPKLFLHRVGRVARAGRSGTAYSIVSPDEIAFLIDLHLFLGRPLTFQSQTKDPAVPSEIDSNSIFVGRMPQDLLNAENNYIRNVMEIRMELANLHKVSKNGYSQYLKSRQAASTESNRRAKTIEISRLQLHPMFEEYMANDPMDNFISQMHSYRPSATIFEIGPKVGTETQKVMKLKRMKDQLTVEKHRTSTVSNLMELEKISQKPTKENEEESFIPYRPSDHHTELGLAVGTTFDKQVQEAVMDLTGDDSAQLKQQQGMMKWDQKKKKFVSMGKEKNGKKIKTESGVWISASYKSNRYETWMRKSKSAHQDNDDEGSDDESYSRNNHDDSKRKPAFSKRLVKTGKNERPHTSVAGGKRFKSELKRPEEILKQRKLKEKNVAKNLPKSMKKNRKKQGGKGNKKSSFSKRK